MLTEIKDPVLENVHPWQLLGWLQMKLIDGPITSEVWNTAIEAVKPK